MKVVVFSKDRPLQLDATLRSLEVSLADFEAADICVLYRASSPRYSAGYRILALQHSRATLHAEADFKADLIALLTGSRHVMFVVDDSIFLAGFSLSDATEALDGDPNLIGFSFRLGRNTTYCYPLDKPQQLPAFERRGTATMKYDWPEAEHDFGYPLELSSSLYRVADVLPIIDGLMFRNPNTLEAGLASKAGDFRSARPSLACYETSVAVSVPANMVQTAWANRVGGRAELASEALMGRYEIGDRIDVARFRGHVTNACHQEVEFRFVRDPAIPTVSVIIPCYEQARYLPDAVQSVVAQTYADWEIVIVDDGSTDETSVVAKNLSSRFGERIRLIRQANRGLPGARNTGVKAALGRFILPLDADDMLEPTMLQQAVELLEREPDIAIAYTDLQQFGGATELIRAAEFDPTRLPEANHLSYCAMYRTEVWDGVGGYNGNMTWGYEDWDFWVGAVERGYRAQRIPQPLFRYRIRSNSMYSTAVQHDRELRQQMRVNHPFTYRKSRRATRWLRRELGVLRARIYRRLARALRTSRTRGSV